MDETTTAERERSGQDKTLAILSVLLPLTYLIHIAEEYWLGEGYLAYLYRIRGVHMSSTRFWIAQILGMGLVIAGIVIAHRLQFLQVMLAIIGAIILGNGLTHTVTAIMQKGYGPGLLSSIFLWIPLGVFTLLYFRNRIIRWKYWMAIGIGIAVNVVVDVITMRGGRLS